MLLLPKTLALFTLTAAALPTNPIAPTRTATAIPPFNITGFTAAAIVLSHRV